MLRARTIRSFSQSALRRKQQHQHTTVQRVLLCSQPNKSATILGSDVVEVEGPGFAESISSGDITWHKKVGDFVKEDEVVAEIETDKTTVQVPSPQNGTIVELLVEDGAVVEGHQKLYKLRPGAAPEGGAPPPAAPKEDKPKDAPPAPAPSKPEPAASTAGAPPTSPPVVPPVPKQPMSVTPPPPKPQPKAVAPRPQAAAGTDPLAITGDRGVTKVKMNRMRQKIAARLKESQNVNAMLTTFNEIDMSNIVELRKTHQKAFEKAHGIKIGFMSPFIKASAYALQDQPVVNAVIEENEIIYRHYVDISVAVASPKGLVVPVLRNVENLTYAGIEKELKRLGEMARDGSLAIEDMEGGTFTVSNGGVFGSLYGTPIINPPQSAILGMHAIKDKAVVVDGQIVIRPIMVVALTYDHRLIDGREAVTFLVKIKQAIEDPRIMLMDL